VSKISLIKETAEKAMVAENERTGRLSGRAEKLTAGTIVVMGFELLSAANLMGSGSRWAEWACYLALAVLALSLFFGFGAIRFEGYANYPRGDKLWETLKPDNVSEDTAEEAIIQMLLRSREQNAKLNDAKARSLSRCGGLLFAGFLLAAVSQLLAPLAIISPPQ
jgi:hypothetical protein